MMNIDLIMILISFDLTVGYAVLAINGQPVNGRKLNDQDVLDDILSNESNFPINIKFVINFTWCLY